MRKAANRKKEKEHSYLTWREIHIRETSLVIINKALKWHIVTKTMNQRSSLQVMVIWDTQRLFPTLTTAFLLHWFMVLQAQLLIEHVGFDSQQNMTASDF